MDAKLVSRLQKILALTESPVEGEAQAAALDNHPPTFTEAELDSRAVQTLRTMQARLIPRSQKWLAVQRAIDALNNRAGKAGRR